MVDVSALALVGKINEAADEADDIECCEAATNDGRLRTASRFSRDAMTSFVDCGGKIIMGEAVCSEYKKCYWLI